MGEDSEHYFRLISSKNRFKEVRHDLSSDGIGPTPPDRWMIMTYMSFLIAQRYKHAVVLLSNKKG